MLVCQFLRLGENSLACVKKFPQLVHPICWVSFHWVTTVLCAEHRWCVCTSSLCKRTLVYCVPFVVDNLAWAVILGSKNRDFRSSMSKNTRDNNVTGCSTQKTGFVLSTASDNTTNNKSDPLPAITPTTTKYIPPHLRAWPVKGLEDPKGPQEREKITTFVTQYNNLWWTSLPSHASIAITIQSPSPVQQWPGCCASRSHLKSIWITSKLWRPNIHYTGETLAQSLYNMTTNRWRSAHQTLTFVKSHNQSPNSATLSLTHISLLI